MTPATAETETVATDAIYFFSRSIIHPDPEQPRVSPDDELQASIDEQGIIQAITVRPHPELGDEWMIVDGERRWRGAAHLEEIPCRIRLDLEDAVDRLVAQMSANTGKPLTAIEEAFAIAKMVEAAPDLSDTEIAKRLGIPRSTVGDRRRMLHLVPCWLELLKTGKLQASHTPILHLYLAVPEKYQIEAAEKFVKDARVAEHFKIGEPVPVESFKSLVSELFDKHLRSLDKDAFPAWPANAEKYEGPVLELSRWGGRKHKYAADPDIWRPILRRASSERAAATRAKSKSGGGRAKLPPHLRTLPEGVKIVKAQGYSYDAPKGFLEVVDTHGSWNVDGYGSRRVGAFDVDVFLQNVEPEKLAVFRREGYGQDSGSVITNDTAAHGLARSAWIERWEKRQTELMTQLRGHLHKTVSLSDLDRTAARYRVDGNGVMFLVAKLAFMTDASLDLLEIAEALGIPGAAEVKEKDAGKWLSKLSIAPARAVAAGFAFTVDNKIDPIWRTVEKEAEAARTGYKKRQVNWAQLGKESPKKNVDVSEIRAAVEAGATPDGVDAEEEVEEEELVEA